MDITLRLHNDSIEAEFTGSNREELQAELIEFKKFLENNPYLENEDASNQADDDHSEQMDLGEAAHTADSEEQKIVQALAPVERTTSINSKELANFLYVDPEKEENPEIIIEDVEVFGGTQVEKQKSASLILLYLWQKCYDVDVITSSKLKDALTGSGIDPKNLFNMYDDDFKRSGSDNSELRLSRSGQLQAQEEIEELANSDT